jgi:hypothetical protein
MFVEVHKMHIFPIRSPIKKSYKNYINKRIFIANIQFLQRLFHNVIDENQQK